MFLLKKADKIFLAVHSLQCVEMCLPLAETRPGAWLAEKVQKNEL